jgi:[ribosomal protein S18]-alanine N-acetyltransferase
MVIRCGNSVDLAAIAGIQAACPEAAQWDVADYQRYQILVAETDGRIAGFLIASRIDDRECDLLNLAVAPDYRRRGIGRKLVQTLRESCPGTIFLEVRESNSAARKFYQSLGFREVTIRPGYYNFPPESGIVMKFFSC